ncbi:MAG: D-alanyl-D-alanine carboxypeptidase [Treponema sp.]|jgi:D-alanyl-D-alanine carboxypeptidase (penicillin-binding protein 5/6)|nr:D-alanyl-D-alanine carboxypeptidase [Treponema sp.]
MLRICLLFCLFAAGSLLPAQDAARSGAAGFAAPDVQSRAAALIDAATGTLLFAKNADAVIPPASLTKLMTMHIALREIAAGQASLDERFPLPRQAWAASQPPRSSLMFLAAGQRANMRELLLGLAVPSGNDAAVAVALRFAPTVAGFVELMNQEAARWGLRKTYFTEPSGISEYNTTTALEFAQFCREYLRLHPETLGAYHSVPSFAYPKRENVPEAYQDNPGTIVQYNHNALLQEVDGVDGLKTGYIDEAGYNIAVTALRGETRLVAVILGAPAQWRGDRVRDEDGKRLLAWGFERFRTIRLSAGPFEPLRVWKGAKNYVNAAPGPASGDGSYTLTFTGYKNRGGRIRWDTEYAEPALAPLPAGSVVGSLVLSDAEGELKRIPLLTTEAVEAGGFFKRLWDSLALFFRRFFPGS